MIRRESPLPSLCLIAEGFLELSVANTVSAAVAAGVGWVQLRAHEASYDAFAYAAKELTGRLRGIRPDVLISINSRLDVARDLEAAFHTGVHGPRVDGVRMQVGLIGASVHSIEEAKSAVEEGADYLVFSPVFATRSKPGAEPAGLQALSAVVSAAAPVPVIALGGIETANARACIRAGAHGIAVLSGILASSDVESAVAAYLAALPSPD